ncbi:MAG TPA: methyltransferase domain-containing protein [Pyrinomonadaceae bacterium]|nr:methyltransferase domain-containing protein [Pyrinomonadaceae bacterium]
MSEKKRLLNNSRLLGSGVVANNRMNRERACLGSNSYQKDLSFDPIEFLKERLANNKFVSWLDICCGEGRALTETATYFADLERAENTSFNLRIIGIDLAGMFCLLPSGINNLTLLETSIEEYEPEQKFDLITCVHGLHYIGDKLSVIGKAAQFLEKDGIFLANLDLKNLKLLEEENSTKIFTEFFSAKGFIWNKRKHLLCLRGGKIFDSPFIYQGADDKAGPNYTGQPAVDSYYKILR